jgi:hypothetical protein
VILEFEGFEGFEGLRQTLMAWIFPKMSDRYLDPDPMLMLEDINAETNPKFHSLNQAIVGLVRSNRLFSSAIVSLTSFQCEK